ncbi:hypothetical protein NPIL_272521 [Nephila pilipes]|uniref:Uncharacterized protein n=1 Tax=Nephila pilipes TaxID=299642 RepID=A0A8X6N7C5_NEPPI|nr:hypothetical protein NPIL_272521 [Nephila pilipes]
MSSTSRFIHSPRDFGANALVEFGGGKKSILSSAKKLLCSLKENNDVQLQKFFSSDDTSYNSSMQYLELWRTSFDKVNKFHWINLRTEISWSGLKKSVQVVSGIIKEGDSRNVDNLFEERTLLNQIIQNQSVCCSSSSEKVPSTIEEKRKVIFKVFQKTDISCYNISRMDEFAMSA